MYLAAGIIVLCVVGLGIYGFGRTSAGDTAAPFFSVPSLFFQSTTTPRVKVEETQPARQKFSVTPGVERFYTNNERTFSFRLPDGFSAPDIQSEEPGVSGVAVHADGGSQLLVLIYRVPTLETLTAESIEVTLGTKLVGVQEGALGTVVRALRFSVPESDRVELWAIHTGKLYRLITASENRALLDFVASNWYFAPPMPSTPQKK